MNALANSTPVRRRLNWQCEINGILKAAGYVSGAFGMLRKSDFDRMDAAFARGETPDEFAENILSRDGYRTPRTTAEVGGAA